MDEHTSHELAYRKGYEQGKQDAMKWIPVTERLPGSARNVLVALNSRGKRYVDIGTIWSDGTCTSYSDEYKINRREHVATHWMPLPTPPKGE